MIPRNQRLERPTLVVNSRRSVRDFARQSGYDPDEMSSQDEPKSRIHPEMLVGVSAVIIGLCALGVSLYEDDNIRCLGACCKLFPHR